MNKIVDKRGSNEGSMNDLYLSNYFTYTLIIIIHNLSLPYISFISIDGTFYITVIFPPKYQQSSQYHCKYMYNDHHYY